MSKSIIPALVIVTALAAPALAQVREGDQAPLFLSVDDKMRTIDMADFVDGTPMVFLYGSAT